MQEVHIEKTTHHRRRSLQNELTDLHAGEGNYTCHKLCYQEFRLSRISAFLRSPNILYFVFKEEREGITFRRGLTSGTFVFKDQVTDRSHRKKKSLSVGGTSSEGFLVAIIIHFADRAGPYRLNKIHLCYVLSAVLISLQIIHAENGVGSCALHPRTRTDTSDALTARNLHVQSNKDRL